MDAPPVDLVALARHTPPGAPVGVGLVLPESPVMLRRAVQTLAEFARRELGYDASGYTAMAPNPDAEAWLWAVDDWDDRARAVGFCILVRDEISRGAWEMTWAWFHPFERGRGRLSRAWPFFERRYGRELVVHERSPAMSAFLAGRHRA